MFTEKKGKAMKMYRFKDLTESGDENCIFVEIEDRGDRVLVMDAIKDMPIMPTNVYRKSELIGINK